MRQCWIHRFCAFTGRRRNKPVTRLHVYIVFQREVTLRYGDVKVFQEVERPTTGGLPPGVHLDSLQ